MQKSTLILSLFLIVLVFKANAQETVNISGYSTEVFYHYGITMPLHESVGYLITDNARIFELNFCKSFNPDKTLAQIYNYPMYGFGFNRNYIGNEHVFGNANSLYAFVNLPLHKRKRFLINVKIAGGLGYFTKYYSKDNYLNIVIGSALNAYINFNLDARFQITKKLKFVSGFGYHHYSNGKIRLPNLGINTVTAFTGIHYSITSVSVNNIQPLKTHKKANEITTVVSIGSKVISVNDGKKYFASSVFTEWNRYVSPKYKAGFGCDLIYDRSISPEIEKLHDEKAENKELFRSGIHVSQALIMGNLSMYVHVGYYVGLKDAVNNSPIYDRLGMQYRLKEKYLINVSINAHFSKAEFIEWGIGYVW